MIDLTKRIEGQPDATELPPPADVDATMVKGAVHTSETPRRRIRLLPETYTARRKDPKTGQLIEVDLSLRHSRQRQGRRPHVGNGTPPRSLDSLEIVPLRPQGEFPALPQAPRFDMAERYRRFQISIEPASEGQPACPFVYLFNVLVALEWRPTQETLLPIMRGLRAASDFLYDATNGCFAFGQVVFAGPELMNQADIQVLASNRFHPRSMVNGLNYEQKFSPIRIGRGSWHKNNRVVLPWDESIAYRAITHEWAHYALSLRDEYIDEMRRVVRRGNRLFANEQGGLVLVVPQVRLPLESLMATLDASELVPLQHSAPLGSEIRSRLLNEIDEWYTNTADHIMQPLSGPQRFPASLPQFYTLAEWQINDQLAEEITIEADNLSLDHCWIYTLDQRDDQDVRMIAQGSLDARAKSFQIGPAGPLIPGAGVSLLGAQKGASALAVGTDAGRTVVRQAALGATTEALHWADCTPDSPPVVAVLPEPNATDWGAPLKVRLHLTGGEQPDLAWVIEPGSQLTQPYFITTGGEREFCDAAADSFLPIAQLDGSILLTWRDGKTEQHWIAEFSHGGNPPTCVRSAGAPISAGSSDGNLLIFSRTEDSDRGEADYDLRIVTTRNYAGFEQGRPGEARSYLFSVASNLPIDYAHYRPTIILYYDSGALDDDKDLQIFRYDTQLGEWQPVSTYLPGGGFYAAAALDAASAPCLVAQYPPGGVRVEYYRLFALPRAGRPA